MTERSSILKELVQYSSENIRLVMNLTEKPTASFDYHGETKQLSVLLGIKVRFVARRSEQAKNSWLHETQFH